VSTTARLDDLPVDARSMALDCLDWCDQWWDDDRALPWGPPGHEGVAAGRTAHLIPQAGWYAVGLLARGGDGDHRRAIRCIDALCSLQYDEPGTDWHGSYPIMAETPHPQPGATMWDDYDPNWRQFLGLSWIVLLERFHDALPDDTVRALRRAVRLGVEGEPAHRCPASYTNIALKRVAFESAAGALLDEPGWVERAEQLAAEVAERHDRFGAFDEYGSPTYYGVDLFALAIGRTFSPSAPIRRMCADLEGSLWRSIARTYHPGLRNLCAPWTRTYGMDMGSYVAKMMFALRLVAPAAAPAPGLAPGLLHGHDLFAGPITALVGTTAPGDAAAAFGRFEPHAVEQRISSTRTATAWLTGNAMAGAEACPDDLSWWEQYVAAALHWATPDGGVGWLSVRMPGPSSATAIDGRLDVPASGGSAGAIVVVGGCGDVAAPSAGRWALPGLDLAVSTALETAGPGPFGGQTFTGAPGESVRLELR
jgi:hypothetical protein